MLYSIHFLRFIAATAVVVEHSDLLVPWNIHTGTAGVDIGPDELVALYRDDLTARREPNEAADIQSAMTTDRMFRQHSIRVAAAHTY